MAPHPLLSLLERGADALEIKQYIAKHQQTLPLFTPFAELNNLSIYEYCKRHGKLYRKTLIELCSLQIFDPNEMDSNGDTLMLCAVEHVDIDLFRYLMLSGTKPDPVVFSRSENNSIGHLLRYRPGKKAPSIYEYATKRVVDKQKLLNMLLDCDETTDDDSTTLETSEDELLVRPPGALVNTYLEQRKTLIAQYQENHCADNLTFVASRGVHFFPEYFSHEQRRGIRQTKKNPHPSYSLSTLLDSGYEAGDEPDENDPKIRTTHKKTLDFITTLQQTPDKKEPKLGKTAPTKSRNEKVFSTLFWREMQMYINSYSTLFNQNAIRTFFGFTSPHNPHVSLSWKTDIAANYALGLRANTNPCRRDPHYRRYDCRPKHPILGYIDVYGLPLAVVAMNGVDRLVEFNRGNIELSKFYRGEAEIIFHSYVSGHYHIRRYLVKLPSCEHRTMTPAEYAMFGYGSVNKYLQAVARLNDSFFGRRKNKDYQEWIRKTSLNSAEKQANLLDLETHMALFSQGKAHAYYHGNPDDPIVSTELPTPTR